MSTVGRCAAGIVLLVSVCALRAFPADLEYPSALRDAYDADENCWFGMAVTGEYPVPVRPQKWLVGPPPSHLSGVTMPTDHWIDLVFGGTIVGADGNDVEVAELGQAGEEALVFLTDGADQEYVMGLAKAKLYQSQNVSYIGLPLPDVETPFAPRGLRIVALDRGGGAPGFDVAYVRARVSRACGARADHPDPVDGADGVWPVASISWTPACDAVAQSVYLSGVRSLVESGDPAVRLAVVAGDVNCYEPNALELNTTYYWRVDAEGLDSGEVWSFTTSDHLMLDDFNSYGVAGGFLYETWNSLGMARVGEDPSYARHSCPQSMRYAYYYDVIRFSETFRRFGPAQDWTKAGARALVFWLYGLPGNDVKGQMYASVADATVEQRVVYDGAMTILTRPEWTAWRIPLADFNAVDLTAVDRVGLGFVWPSAQSGQFGEGTIYVDDLSLSAAMCTDECRPTGDLTGDCRVDHRDLQQMAADWLRTRGCRVAVVAPDDPVLWYRFDGNASDSAGRAHGQIEGRPTFEVGVNGRAIRFANDGDAVTVTNAATVFERTDEAITITFWARGTDSAHRNDTICCSNYSYGRSNPSMAIHLGCWRDPGQYRWDCGTPWSFANRLAGRHRCRSEWAGRWNHWAFTKDIRVGPEGGKGRMQIYLNGVLYDSRMGTDSPIEGIESFTIGTGWYGHYDGLIDDFRIYDYVLPEAEIAYLATDGTGMLPWNLGLAGDLDGSGTVDFDDFALLAEQWLDNPLWP
ncbi:MAG: LamG domain-containing protein [Planctomycetota bacterium]|nr:LamG domain-containing protein [Planctomycetota bacterium]